MSNRPKKPSPMARHTVATFKRGAAAGYRKAIEEAEQMAEQTVIATMYEAGLTELVVPKSTLEETLRRYRLSYRHDPESETITYTLLDMGEPDDE